MHCLGFVMSVNSDLDGELTEPYHSSLLSGDASSPRLTGYLSLWFWRQTLMRCLMQTQTHCKHSRGRLHARRLKELMFQLPPEREEEQLPLRPSAESLSSCLHCGCRSEPGFLSFTIPGEVVYNKSNFCFFQLSVLTSLSESSSGLD